MEIDERRLTPLDNFTEITIQYIRGMANRSSLGISLNHR